MRNTYILIVLSVCTLGLGFAVWIQRQGLTETHRNELQIHRQQQIIDQLGEEQSKLSNRIAHAVADSHRTTNEIAELQQRARSLESESNRLAAAMASRSGSSKTPNPPKPQPRPPEYYQELHKRAGAKAIDARNLSQAILGHANDHQGRVASALSQLDLYLRQQGLSLSGTNQFDLVFQGTLAQLQSVPGGAVALLRDRQVWTAPSGKPARVYGLANGASLIVESDDDFKAWEAEHILHPTSGATNP